MARGGASHNAVKAAHINNMSWSNVANKLSTLIRSEQIGIGTRASREGSDRHFMVKGWNGRVCGKSTMLEVQLKVTLGVSSADREGCF